MKVVFAIVKAEDSNLLADTLIDEGYSLTRVSSAGGFFRRGNTTLMIGVEDDQVDALLQIIRDTCPTPEGQADHRATLFVVPAEGLLRI
jgi:uncharacterized protein YaaQ